MNMFDVLLARQMNSAPLPPNAHLATAITSQPVTDASDYPLPKCDITVTDAEKCEVIVTDDGVIVEDSEPYNYRQSAGGDTELDELIGGTVAWNQLVDTNTTEVTPTSGHKILTYIGGTWAISVSDGTALSVTGGTDMLHDLTLLVGSTIADYIYQLEQSTAGAGVAWLKEHFPKLFDDGYKAYNAGELVSVKTTAHVMRDSNDVIVGSYPLSPVELRGLFKLDTNNKLYCDGDSYRCDGQVQRRYGIVDLGTLSWAKQDHATLGTYFYGNVASLGIKRATGDYSQNVANAICSNYTATKRYATVFTNKTFCYDDSATSVTQIQIKDDNYSDAATFKTAMSGVYLVYEPATPTEEQTSPFEKNQAVDAGGTEEYIDDRSVSVPVGHNTKYYHGKAYTKYFAQKSGVVSMADEGIMPMNPMYISANGEIDAEYWR